MWNCMIFVFIALCSFKFLKAISLPRPGYIPHVRLILGFPGDHSKIRERDNVSMNCLINDYSVTEVSWYFEGENLKTVLTKGISVNHETLVLQNLRKDNRGRYACSALNVLGRKESNPLYLRVQYAPVCKANQTLIYRVPKNKPSNISCQVEADPSEVDFRWTFTNTLKSIDLANYTNEGLMSEVTFMAMADLDYGRVMCWANNIVGRQKEPCIFIVVPEVEAKGRQRLSSSVIILISLLVGLLYVVVAVLGAFRSLRKQPKSLGNHASEDLAHQRKTSEFSVSPLLASEQETPYRNSISSWSKTC